MERGRKREEKRSLVTYIKKFTLVCGVAIGGVLLVIVGLFAANKFVSPIARVLLGDPYGFGEDFVSIQAWTHVIVIRLLCIGLLFFLLGAFAGRTRHRAKFFSWSLLFANPVTLAIAMLIYEDFLGGTFIASYGYRDLVIFSLSGMLLAPLIVAGSKFRGSAHIRKLRN